MWCTACSYSYTKPLPLRTGWHIAQRFSISMATWHTSAEDTRQSPQMSFLETFRQTCGNTSPQNHKVQAHWHGPLRRTIHVTYRWRCGVTATRRTINSGDLTCKSYLWLPTSRSRFSVTSTRFGFVLMERFGNFCPNIIFSVASVLCTLLGFHLVDVSLNLTENLFFRFFLFHENTRSRSK